MRINTSLITIIIGISVASIASATPYIATSEPPEPPGHRRTELHIGMLAGSANIGDVDGSGFGLQLEAARRMGDLSLLVQFEYMGVGESEYTVENARRGSLMRGGLAVRYAFMEVGGGEDIPIGGNFYLEAGGGRHLITWDGGGTLGRTDVSLAFGFQLDAVLGRKTSKKQYLGPYFAVRAIGARAPRGPGDATPTCGGPCDSAGGPSRNDISIFFNFGMHLGR